MYKGLIIFLLGFSFGCSFMSTGKKTIKIVGSDTMFELNTKLAEGYMKENPSVSILVEGGGTALGIKALINNKTDICSASRNLKPDEAKQLAEYYGSLGLVYLIAKDALSVYVNKENNVSTLNLNELKNIFSGKIANWKSVGGKDSSILRIIRNPNSGTYLYFKEHILENEDYSEDAIVESTTKEIINLVESNKNAIGYGGMGYSGNITHLKINGIEPSENNVRNDSYPIIRYLHYFTTKTPDGEVKRFIDWVLSPSGQSIVRESGYISLWENNLW